LIRAVYFHYADHMPSYLSVTEHIPGAEHVDTSASSYAYWDEIEKRWDGTVDLLLIEQHIIVHDQVLPQLEACDGDWCEFLHQMSGGGLVSGLACTRFSAALQLKVPATAIRARARRKCPHCGAPHFAFIDGPVYEALQAAGHPGPHIHEPPVTHLPE